MTLRAGARAMAVGFAAFPVLCPERSSAEVVDVCKLSQQLAALFDKIGVIPSSHPQLRLYPNKGNRHPSESTAFLKFSKSGRAPLPDAGVAIRPVYWHSAIFLVTSTLTAGVTVTYTDPNFGNDATAIQTPGGVDAASFTVSAVSGSGALAAEAAPLTATFGNVPTRHGAEAFTLELAFSEPVQVTAEQLASALSVSNGAVTQAAQADAQSTRDWLVTVTPAGSDAVTVALVPKQSCEEEGAVCTADGRGLADEAEAEVPGRTPTRVVSATVTSGPGANGVWDEGERVEAQVRFSRPVGVHGPPGARGPVLDVLLDGTAYEAAYTGGSGTDTFSFRYTVTAAAAGAVSAGVASNGLAANGVILGDDEGQEAELGFEAEPDAAPPPTRLTVVRRLAENAAPGAAVGPPVVAGDPDDDTLTYSLDGEDAGAFAIDAATGQLRAKAGVFYDYELKPVYSVLVVADDGNGNSGSIGVRIELSDVDEVLTASFEEAPATHGLAPFALRLRFSEPVDVDRETLRDRLLQVTNGRAARARRLDEDRGLEALTGQSLSALWELTVEPSPTGGDVTVALPAKDCAADYAACTRDGRPLSDGARVTVSRGTLPALTAQSSGAPETHDRAAFELRVEFSWRVTATPEAMRTEVLEVTNGEVAEAFRIGDGGTAYGFRILPWSNGGVTVVLPATGDCAAGGAVCTADGRMLLQGIDWQIEPEDPDAVDETAPEPVQAEANAMSLVLLYDEGLDADSGCGLAGCGRVHGDGGGRDAQPRGERTRGGERPAGDAGAGDGGSARRGGRAELRAALRQSPAGPVGQRCRGAERGDRVQRHAAAHGALRGRGLARGA